jgi:integrase
MRKKLTNSAVDQFKCPPGKTSAVLWCGATAGFGVRVSQKGARSYILQFRVKGDRSTERCITLGRHRDPLTCDDARTHALELKARFLRGEDPVAEDRRKVAEAQAQAVKDAAFGTTLRQLVEQYVTTKRLRPRTQADIRYCAETYLAGWLDEPVTTIKRDRCLAKFNEISKRSAWQANKTMRYLRAQCHFFKDQHETDDGDYPVMAVNPVARMIKKDKLHQEKARTTRIKLSLVGRCYAMLRKRAVEARYNDDSGPDWISVILLTGMRHTESAALRWRYIDFKARTLTVPGQVSKDDPAFSYFAGTKNRNDLEIPMSDELFNVLRQRKQRMDLFRGKRANDYVFPATGKCPFIAYTRATMDALRAEACEPKLTVHDLRRTFDDIAAEAKCSGDQRRLLLNHKTGDVHAVSYANGTQVLVSAVQAIGTWITEQQAVANGENVLPFEKKAARKVSGHARKD